jgi:DNA invertase Pin-like site-specific DNA recombinase
VKLGSARPGHWGGIEHKRQAGLKKTRKAAAEARRKAFDREYADLVPVIRESREAGRTYQAIADELNEMGQTTRRGRPWNRTQVLRVLRRSA